MNAMDAREARHKATDRGRGYRFVKHHYKMQRRLFGGYAPILLFDARGIDGGLRTYVAAACRHIRKLIREGADT